MGLEVSGLGGLVLVMGLERGSLVYNEGLGGFCFDFRISFYSVCKRRIVYGFN